MIRSLKQIDEDYKNGVVTQPTQPTQPSQPTPIKEQRKFSQGGGVKNFYELESVQEHMEKIPNPHIKDHGISLHFNAILCAMTGGGKTNVLFNLLTQFHNTFNHIYIFTQNKEPLYDHITEQLSPEVLTIVYGGYRGFLMFQKKNPDAFYGNSLVVFDDMSQEKIQESIREHFILGRKRSSTKGAGCSSMYLSQTYSDIPVAIRGQANLIFIIKMDNYDSLKRLLRNYALGVSKEQLINMYRYSCEAGHFGNFFLIDTKQSDQLKKFRCNFDDYLNPEDFN
jgi:hypothetical protein